MMENETITPETQSVKNHRVVSLQQWTEDQKQHLTEEKEFTRMYDQIMAKRRELPWVRVEKDYIFDGPNGKVTFADLFEGRSQLIIQHFMFGPDDQEGCVGCSFTADHVDSARMHFEQNDVSFAAISRAPVNKLSDYKKRMEWSFNWVSSLENDFNYDYHVSFRKEDLEKGKVYYNFQMQDIDIEELPGTSVFYKDETGVIFHTYSSYGRGAELLLGTYNYLDLTPKGRNENGPNKNLTDWVRHHDKYERSGYVDHTGKYHQKEEVHSCCSPEDTKS